MASAQDVKGVPSTSRGPQKYVAIKYYNYRSDDYEIISTSALFIDKTLLIKEVLNHSCPYLLIATPKGFGKSTNLDMIRRFVEMNIDKETGRIGLEENSPNYALFEKDRLISADKEFIKDHFAKYAVIKISFKDIYDRSIHSLKAKYFMELSKLFADHKYLLQSDKITTEDKQIISKYIDPISNKKLPENDLEGGIAFLAKMLSIHCPDHKVFTFIDDYDSPLLMLMDDYRASNQSENACLSFFRNIFANILPPNEDIHRVFFTGQSTVGSILFPPDHPVDAHEFLTIHPFLEYYGITTNEIDGIIRKYNMEESTKHIFIIMFGYVSLDTNLIVCTSAVIQFLITGKFIYENKDFPNILRAVRSDIIRYLFEKAVQQDFFPYITHPYTQDSIHDIRKICVTGYGEKELLSIKYRSYMHLLRELGFFKARKGPTENVLLLKAANKNVKDTMLYSLKVNFAPKFDERVKDAALHFNTIAVATEKMYFLQFNCKLREVYKEYFAIKGFHEWNSIYSPFLSIVGRSFFDLMPVHYESDTSAVANDGLHATFTRVGVNIGITYKASPQAALEEILQKTNESNWAKREFYTFVGINFNEEFSATFGIVLNSTDINNAIYHTFEQFF